MLNQQPVFAVVGHPNKGKSSIVSTLVRQDAIKISALSGTTTQAQAFALMVNDQLQYTLVDTPGFQRPRQVLQWLQSKAVDASQRQWAVEQFVADTRLQKFADEQALLAPIIEGDGAGILYVVDGSIPYSAEFEAEMSILQWTGQPRMALINPIGGEQYIDQWQAALSQYFSVVRVFNPMSADQHKQFTLLTAFAELHEPWRAPLERVVYTLQTYQHGLDEQAADICIDALQQMMRHKVTLKVPAAFAEAAIRDQLKRQYQQALRDVEAAMQRQLKALYAHSQLTIQSHQLDIDTPDLFDTDQWYLYGLDRSKIIALATSAGMAAGAVIDASVGGASLMLGAIAGGFVSSVSSALATWKPEKFTIKGVPVAGKALVAGPVTDLAFSFVLLGRMIDFYALIRQRTHADRRTLQLAPSTMTERLQKLSKVEQVKLTRLLSRSHKGLSAKDLLQLRAWILLMA